MAVIAAAMLVVNPSFLAYVQICPGRAPALSRPRPAISVAGCIQDDGCRLSNMLRYVAIVLIIVKWDFIAGVFVGVVIGLRHVRAERRPGERNQI